MNAHPASPGRRSAPEPSLELTVAFEAYAYAGRFHLDEVAAWLPHAWEAHRTKTQLVGRGPAGEALLAFDFGALVFVDVAPALRDTILATAWQSLPPEPHPPLCEVSRVEVRPQTRASDFLFDTVVVPKLTPRVTEVIARGLAQSACLDYYDEDLQSVLDRVGRLAAEIGRAGRLTAPSRELLRFVGTALASQVEILGSLTLLDKPEATWEDELAYATHGMLRRHLEIDERYATLKAKLDAARQAILALLDLVATRRALWLESAIVLLIVFEIALSLARLG